MGREFKTEKVNIRLSYAITVCNELVEVQRLIECLQKYKRTQDQIVVLVDLSKNEPTSELLGYLHKLSSNNVIKLKEDTFQGDFAEWKNKLTSSCTGDFIFQIDADEYVYGEFIDLIHEILEANPEVDLYYVPRINTVSGLTQEHIQRWGWNVDSLGRVNWPDYQTRIYRNSTNIKWKNKVHEVIEGYTQYTVLPAVDELALIHPKTIERQERQNNYYATL
jgi:hypothetical protein